jgi:tetratricopeptide (TPR) repeat protein
MASNRVEVLRAMLAQDPKNSFARYGLAMEQVKAGQLEEAIAEFRGLIAADPAYAAAYFHSGQTLEKLGRLDEARAAYESGIEVTARTGDAHACSELQAALDLLPV